MPDSRHSGGAGDRASPKGDNAPGWREAARELGRIVVRRGVTALVVSLATYFAVLFVWTAIRELVRPVLEAVRPAFSARSVEARSFTILSVNDVYRIGGLPEERRGGLARLRTLRAQLERRGDVLLLHAGDFLGPSFESRTFHGAQMIDVMNLLDGDEELFDYRMVVTFGNHEFDDRDAEGGEELSRRIGESRFYWLGTDITFKGAPAPAHGVTMTADSTAAPPSLDGIGTRPQLLRNHLVSVGGVWVGIFSLSLVPPNVAYVDDRTPRSDDERFRIAREQSAELRARGAEFVVALTHLPADTDVRLLRTLGRDGPDLIVGGHDHGRMRESVDGRWVVKSDADARTATPIVVTLDDVRGADVRVARAVELGDNIEADPAIAAHVRRWDARHDTIYCGTRAPTCLDSLLAQTDTRWDAAETDMRGGETAVGDWIADLMLARYTDPPVAARVALVNAGALRLNRTLPPGTPITLRHVEELVGGFTNRLVVLDLPAPTLTRALARSMACRGEGAWLQVAGVEFRAVPGGGVAEVRVGGVPLGPEDTVRTVTLDFLADTTRDQDGYRMLSPTYRVAAPTADLRSLVLRAVSSGNASPRLASPARIHAAAGDEPSAC